MYCRLPKRCGVIRLFSPQLAAAQLAAGRVDIRPELAAHGRGHAALFQRLLEAAHGLRPRGPQRAFRHLVERDEVDVRRAAAQQLCQLLGLPGAVGLVPRHHVFIGDAPAGGIKIVPARRISRSTG